MGLLETAALSAIASGCIVTGCHLSRGTKPKDEDEVWNASDAIRMPVMASVFLFTLYILLKIMNPAWVSLLLSVPALLFGFYAISALLERFTMSWHPGGRTFRVGLRGHALEMTLLQAAMRVLAAALVLWYVASRAWVANNLIAASLAIHVISSVPFNSFSVASLILLGLFFYDIFWVFATPVMISVATRVDAPIKLLFPSFAATGRQGFSLLGLGDVIIPGWFLALVAKYDSAHKRDGRSLFFGGILSYVFAISTAGMSVTWFNYPQPALLYLVPALIGTACCQALAQGRFRHLMAYDAAAAKTVAAAAKTVAAATAGGKNKMQMTAGRENEMTAGRENEMQTTMDREN